MLRDAHLQRVRQQSGAAEVLCRQALELAPDDLMGREMLADLLLEKGRLDEALEIYRPLFAEQPQRAVLEEKIARIVLRKDDDERERLTAQFMLDSPRGARDQKRNLTLAVLLSLFCAGLGQMFNGQYVKGGILLGTWLLSIFGWGDLFRLVLTISGLDTAPAGPRGARSDLVEPNAAMIILGMAGLLIHIYSVLDAAAQAGKPVKKSF